MSSKKLFIFTGFIFFMSPISLKAEEQKRALPRFASLRSDEINMRRGPGSQYPNDWTYVRAHMPVEIIAEYNVWRKIRDHEGTEGWVHQAMLSGHRYVIVTARQAKLYKHAEENPAKMRALVEKNVIAKLLECKAHMCKVRIADHKGWMVRQHIWGVKADEQKIK